MSRPNRSVKILISPALRDWKEVKELQAKGYTVHEAPEDGNPWVYDVILGPTCWRMTDRLRLHFDAAIKEARRLIKGS